MCERLFLNIELYETILLRCKNIVLNEAGRAIIKRRSLKEDIRLSF